MDTFIEFIIIITLILVGILLFFAILLLPINYITVNDEIIQIEQLRYDYSINGAENSQDIRGQVTKVNRNIRSMQYWNTVFFCSLYIPNKWDTVKIINLSK